jgi:hypothetical protein
MGDLRAAAPRIHTVRSADSAHVDAPANPLEFVQPRDMANLARVALSLQRTAGNRAVVASLAQLRARGNEAGALHVVNSVSSNIAPARGGVKQIATSATGLHAAGVTSLPAPGAPDVVIGAPLKQTDGKWQATINSTSVTPDAATSLFPGPGVHDEEPTATGLARERHVTQAASNEIKAGEEEHLSDLEWARHLAYDQVSDAVNRAASSGPLTGSTADDAKAVAMYRVRSEVPDKARWPDGTPPITHWRRLYGRLVAVTQERDSPNKWHSMSSEFVLDAAEKKKLGVPKEHELVRYRAGTTEVGKHPSDAVVNARYQSQPAEPMGQPPASMFSPPPAKAGPTGDFEPSPGKNALAVRANRPKR